ncbi:hypothetical protein J6590_016628 [Homalodisca vitripennis]|nr:hypothetical protein J6590_016628 [Homalodisca vitripennis]
MFQNVPSPARRVLATRGCPGGRASVALSLSSFQNDVVDRAIKGRTVSSAGDRPKWRQQLTFEETLTQRPRDLSKLSSTEDTRGTRIG